MKKVLLFLAFVFVTSVSFAATLTASRLPKASSGNIIEDSGIYDVGTKIGIGSSDPRTYLDIEGAVYLSSTITDGALYTATATTFAKMLCVSVDGTIYSTFATTCH